MMASTVLAITGEARVQQWQSAAVAVQSTVATLFTTVSHCSIKKILISVDAAAPTAAYLASPMLAILK
jgi:hypothetical protein